MRNSIASESWMIAVYMIVRNGGGRVLMLKRNRTSRHFPGLWELPGGKPTPGENLARTAEREVFEETGVCVSPTGVAGAVEASIPGWRVAMLIMEGRATDYKITLSSEHDCYRWMAPARIHSLKLRPGMDTFFALYPLRRRKRASRDSNKMKANPSGKRK